MGERKYEKMPERQRENKEQKKENYKSFQIFIFVVK